MWDVISWAIRPTDTHRKQFHRLPRFQCETKGISLFQANWNTLIGWRLQNVSYKPLSPSTHQTLQSSRVEPLLWLLLNTPGQDFGKYSQGHDRIQKAWNHFLEYLTQPKDRYNETIKSKTNPAQLFSSAWYETRANFQKSTFGCALPSLPGCPSLSISLWTRSRR